MERNLSRKKMIYQCPEIKVRSFVHSEKKKTLLIDCDDCHIALAEKENPPKNRKKESY